MENNVNYLAALKFSLVQMASSACLLNCNGKGYCYENECIC